MKYLADNATLHQPESRALSDLLGREPFSIERTVRVAQGVLRALSSLHTAGRAHQAVNPRNILLGAGHSLLRLTDAAVGQLHYTAPELLGDRQRPADARSDFYSLGATLYALCCGYPPFTQEEAHALTRAILTEPVVAPRQLNPHVPAALSAVIMKLLARAPDERYQRLGGIESDLQQVMAQVRGEPRPFILGRDDHA